MKLIYNPNKAELDQFYKLVFDEWGEDFAKIEKDYKCSLVLGSVNDKVVTGLSLFNENIPENESFKNIIDYYSHQKMLYIGYFVLDKSLRGQGIGSQFLQKFLGDSFQNYWLVIENLALEKFYRANGFKLYCQIGNEKVLDNLP